MKTREEHLAWCKQRALEYIDRGQINEGLTSMMSDMSKHPRTGKPYTSEGYRACWQRCMRKWMRGGGENFHFHDIRALAATRCATPEIAMRLLGHTTLSMTMRVYRRGIERVQALSI